MHRSRLMLGLVLALAACARPARTPLPQEPPPSPPPISAWPGTLAGALRSADLGEYQAADAALAQYAQENAGTSDGLEADFWRALLRLDPFNRGASLREARASLDAYMNAGPASTRYREAQILRRVVESLDSSRSVIASERAAAESRGRARDEEIRKLGEELDKTMAELERIRRRLAQKPGDRG
jgi:hypothetical protein